MLSQTRRHRLHPGLDGGGFRPLLTYGRKNGASPVINFRRASDPIGSDSTGQ